jgi:hypothetical protein
MGAQIPVMAEKPLCAIAMHFPKERSNVNLTAEIALVGPPPPRPYPTRSHMHTGPLVITIATPIL